MMKIPELGNEEQMPLVSKGREYLYDDSILYLVHSIDLSSNNLSGEIPDNITSLTRLLNMNLSMNHLTGRIPEKIGNLHMLESLDLSWNELSGPIPESLSSLNFLSHLNLSFNNLSGKFQLGINFKHLMTFLSTKVTLYSVGLLFRLSVQRMK
jgi:Leucine-rich repeat (LRR) protein